MKKGDRVRVIAPGEFYGYSGTVSRVTQHSKVSRMYIWVVFDRHPWQRHGVDWSFVRQELE